MRSKAPAGITGARWVLAGAEAVLRLRTVITNGDFEDHWQHHARRERQRLYPALNRQKHSLTS